MSYTLTVEDILACEGLPLAIDVETTGLSSWHDGLIGIGIHCPKANVSGYVHTCSYEDKPYGKPKKREVDTGEKDYSKSKRGKKVVEVTWEPDIVSHAVPSPVRAKHFLAAVQKIAQNPETTFIGHNLKFDAHFLGLQLWNIPAKILDTVVLAHLLDSRQKKSMGDVEKTYLNTQSKRSHVAKAPRQFSKKAWLWGESVLEDYCTNDCVVTYQLAEVMMPEIREMDLTKLLTLQMKYLRLLQKIEWRGILLEESFCHKAIIEFEKNIGELEGELFDIVGYEFNWRSPQQLSKALYDNFALKKPVSPFPEGAKNAAAKMYTNSATGTSLLLQTEHPLHKEVIVLRETAKLKEYAEKYLTLQDSDGVIHASFNITGTVTGRLSSSQPNLQQLAAKYRKYDIDSIYTGGTERVGSYNLRQSLIARPGYKIISIDHKQQEARLLAILSGEPDMIKFMADRKDIHLEIAMRIWGDCGKEQNKTHRDWSKAFLFGTVYGMSEESLQEHFKKLGIEADAYVIRSQFFSTFPTLQDWFEKIVEQIQADGDIRYWSGRYWIPDYASEAYKGINAIIQGGSGDFLSLVLVRANQVLEAQGYGYLVSIIHDEALFEIKENCVDEAAPILARIFESPDVFGVPFLADIEVGDSYGSLEEFKTDVDISQIEWQSYLEKREMA